MRALDLCFLLMRELMQGTAHRTKPSKVMDHPAMKRKGPFLMVKSNEDAMTIKDPKAMRTIGTLSVLVVTFMGRLSVPSPH
jgi:hypothetical protein